MYMKLPDDPAVFQKPKKVDDKRGKAFPIHADQCQQRRRQSSQAECDDCGCQLQGKVQNGESAEQCRSDGLNGIP